MLDREEIEEKERIEIEKELRVLWFFWAGCFGSLLVLLLMCAGFGEMLRENIEVRPDFPINMFKSVFIVAGILSLALAYFLRRRLLAGKSIGLGNKAVEMLFSANQPTYLLKYRYGIYPPMAISVSPGFYGFVLFMVGGDALIFYLFLIIAALSALYHRPKKGEIITLLQKEKAQGQG
ncbi:MAG: hypothetical protein GWN67_20030 [Phycisphaerae bacterium]|nr:hypothetical protein [Phycisphaerae bacterium]NIW94889.1 hypothetical protein [Phycisphaerae bacterium]